MSEEPVAHRHEYWVNDHEGGGYAVVGTVAGALENVGGLEKVSRDEALSRARDVGARVNVAVWPCACGKCALSRYAGEHPRSILAVRVGNRVGDLVDEEVAEAKREAEG